MNTLLLSLYNLIWRLALLFLKRNPRLAQGWEERTMQQYPSGPFDLWIQAASGGESMLTNMVVEALADMVPDNKTLRILVTSGTGQGVDSLRQGVRGLPSGCNLEVQVSYFPFDAPSLMQKVFARTTPRLVVIMETELWPGFLVTARKQGVPVLLINGRMSEKSFNSYKYFSRFFKKYGPARVLAISALDRERFSRIVGGEKVALMNNIKFDRIEPQRAPVKNNAVADLVDSARPFLLLGSIRREEEPKILKAICALLAARPELTVGLFPKHIERADHWMKLLKKEKIAAVKRSSISSRQGPASVIVWDLFGELAGAYALAEAAFVGGSLENLGGQNFLEPLIFGLRPVIGPYWKNFAWVGRDIVTSELVLEVPDEEQLVTRLLDCLDAETAREQIIKRVETYFKPLKGGTRQACLQIMKSLMT